METMIQAAHQLLGRGNHEEEFSSSRSSTVKLSEFMDSFPLIPLSVIPQLSIRDLEQVERGLIDLVGSLLPHESDQQLGRYAARELALVQQHLTCQRAQERVFQLLRGDLQVDLAPVETKTLRKCSSAAAAVPIRSSKELESTLIAPLNRPKSGRRTRVSPALLPQSIQTQATDSRGLQWKSRNAVEMARAMVQANAGKKMQVASTSSFVVSAGSKKRRRPRPVKRSSEEEAEYQAQQLERDREHRRQAAHQRIIARQALQAKKKQEQTRQKKKEQNETTQEVNSDGVKLLLQKDDDSASDSEASDVSNCSESDEANEQAILALDVQIQPTDDNDEGDIASGDDKDDASVDVVDDDQDKVVDEQPGAIDRPVEPPTGDAVTEEIASTAPELEPNVDVVADDTKSDQVDEAPLDHSTNDKDNDMQPEQEQTNTFNLHDFITSRAAAKLKQLRAEKESRANCVDESFPPAKSPSAPTNCQALQLVANKEDQMCIELQDNDKQCEWVDSIVQVEMRSDQSKDLPQQNWIDEVRQSSAEFAARPVQKAQTKSKKVGLPRAPVAECKDYHFYFSNFHCILTSVFEQYQGHNSAHISSSSSLYHRPIGASGEHTMRLQQKLYESWQSIMNDYATVFGPKIIAPEGMVPMAVATPWTPHYRINSTARKEVSEIVTEALQRLGGGWEEHPSGLGLKTTWNLLWTWSKPRVERQTLLAWQKVNHFQHAKALTRKDYLKKHIGKYIAAGGRLRQAFDIIPPTFLLPKEYVQFVQAFQERAEKLRREGFSEGKNIWIMKPVALSRGRGISLVNDLGQVIYGEQVVIQEYIANPRLLDGFKFDLRLYVLVTSFNPLEAFLYDEGFVRLCTRPYEDGDLSNIFIHLTNSSIQKDNEEAIAGSSNPIANVSKESTAQTDAGGTKTTLAYLWRRLTAEGVNVDQVKRNIEEVVLKALLCGEDHIPYQVNSFDLLGYDILLDAELRPWLIEINSSPSMARDNDLDYHVKDAMMLNTLRIVDPLHFDRTKLAEVIARRQRDVEEEKRRPHAHTRHPREAEELAARQCNEDLTAILRGRVPRAYGEIPEQLGNYRRLCPHTTTYNQLVKLKRSCLRMPDRK